MSDLHLCNSYRHLLLAMASIAGQENGGTIVYLEDALPIAAQMRDRLQRACPRAEFIYTSDAAECAAFARLPKVLPAILRRNLTLGGPVGLRRARDWPSPRLGQRHFATGYLYHAGFFFSKVAAGYCDRVVLRESGLNNYIRLPVRGLKRLLRLASGLSPHFQVWGEESWIHLIEVARPGDLPAEIRSKARAQNFGDVMGNLPSSTAQSIAMAFLEDPPSLSNPRQPTALLLTQPLDGVGICSAAEKTALYIDIAQALRGIGYQLYVKHHPNDQSFDIPGAQMLPKTFPIEAWPYCSSQRFDLSVAICSASLTGDSVAFSKTSTQLLPQSLFDTSGFPHWPAQIGKSLSRLPYPAPPPQP